jgi:diguanylate cyclase (GGDEF)-like protein
MQMKSSVSAAKSQPDSSAKSLSNVLNESEHAQGLMQECAEDLFSVNETLKQELSGGDHMPAVEDALEKSEAAESKAQEASAKLSIVNRALVGEVKERHVLQTQLLVVTEQEEVARHAAFHDPLTKLPNRALFNDRLELGLALTRRHGWSLAVMFVDLDNFKAINDSYGHGTGDEVLRTIGERLNRNVRGGDTISRYGGDEFLYLLLEIQNERDISVLAEKIITLIQMPCQIRENDTTCAPAVSASVGIAIFPRDGKTASELIRSADMAMYEAKRDSSGYAFATRTSRQES